MKVFYPMLSVVVGLGLLVSAPMSPAYAKAKTKLRVSESKVAESSKRQSIVATATKTNGDKFSQLASRLLAKTEHLDKQVLELAIVAQANAKRKGLTHSNVLTVVDYSLPSTTKRLWIFDLNKETLLFHDYVAHGVTSGGVYTTRFSNEPGSRASSYGVYLTGQTYSGQHGLSLKVDGLEANLNDNARRRAVVVHGGSYVSTNVIDKIGRLGRSWGCFTLREAITKPVVETIKNKTVIFAYYPNFKWLATSKFLDRRQLI